MKVIGGLMIVSILVPKTKTIEVVIGIELSDGPLDRLRLSERVTNGGSDCLTYRLKLLDGITIICYQSQIII